MDIENKPIPESNKILENIHIIFWLIKDLCWAMLWKPLGLFMIIPTFVAAIIITYQTYKIRVELFHNLAIIFWVIGNAYWMISEFFYHNDTLRNYASIPFGIGLLILAYYYIELALIKKQRKS